MTKSDLVDQVAETTSMSKKDSAEVVDAVFKAMRESLSKGEKVQLIGFGTFEVRERAEREGRNPQDPTKTIKIPAKKVPVFRPGKELKEAVEPKPKPVPKPAPAPVKPAGKGKKAAK